MALRYDSFYVFVVLGYILSALSLTLLTFIAMNISIPFSEACERNKDVILKVIERYLRTVDTVLEIGSGTAQHALHFSQALRNVQWQSSDQYSYLEGINAALFNAKKQGMDIENLLSPVELNVNQDVWLESGKRFDAVYTANTFHIMSESDVEAFFNGLPSVCQATSYLIVYGPFKYRGQFTSQSNARFDETLKSRGVGSGIRDFEFVNDLAAKQKFALVEDYAMPANNQCLVWQRGK